jgi:ribonuclease P protein component
LFKEGKSIAVFPIRITYKFTDIPQPVLQAGFSASTRNFKKAVSRNRIKRLMRESYRKQKDVLEQHLATRNYRLALFIIYTGKELPNHELVEEKMTQVLQKLLAQLK